ncbi:DUF4349 domain-containing protein [Chondrinema litorale]|uniref:DUF4349 domain-containing protein n=1 Tax=Chondrinema litorale TaxID=2994555 RepID=UPI0025438903|nr:DUF4349 domain-containing protein [Chondrinema litorale]UZR93586.1 DUF4349 domain-containing protein [Chondrinema litorale]
MRKTYIIFLLSILVSCQLEQSRQETFSTEAKVAESALAFEDESYDDAEFARSISNKQEQNQSPSPQEKKLIKTADIRYQVIDIEACYEKVKKLVADSNAVIFTSNQENYSYQVSYNLVIRVENKKFEGLVESLVSYADFVNSKQINTQDVTEEFVDISARLNAKKKIEERYLEILKQAKSIEEILEVEKKLGEIREEIDATEGRLRYLSNQVSLSTIRLSFYQTIEQENTAITPGFLSRIGKGLNSGWDIFLDFIVSLSYIWPFIILAIIAFYIIKALIKRRRKKKTLSNS